MTVQKCLLVVGGTSDIGHAVALIYAQAGWRILLAARDPDAARRNADDITVRAGAEVIIHGLDVLNTDRLVGFVDGLGMLPDTVVCVVGELGDQKRAETDLALARTSKGPRCCLGFLPSASRRGAQARSLA